MKTGIVLELIAKDVSLMRVPLAAYTAGAAAGLALAAFPESRGAGITLALNILIGVSLHVMLVPVLGERGRKTLAFVMSLPVTPRGAAAAKLLSAFLMFLIPATIAATALVFLSPVDVFHAMAASDRSAIARGGPALPMTLGAELFGIALVVTVILELQGRKTSFV